MPKTLEQKPILVASDLSARSDRAMHRAFDMARRQELPVVVLTTLDDEIPQDMIDHLHARAVQKLERFAASLAEDVDHRVIAQMGDPTEQILKGTNEIDPALLVMGVHRERGLFDGLRETTMQRVVRHTACPVLLVRDTADHPYRSVLAACDFSPAATAAMELADSLAETETVQPVHALHVPYSGMLGHTRDAESDLVRAFETEVRQMDHTWRRAGVPAKVAPETEIVPGSPYAVVSRLVEIQAIDLICAGAHGRVGAAPAILGSLANDLMRDPPCDLLIARP